MGFLIFLIFLTVFAYTESRVSLSNRTFSVDYDRNTFLKDGEPFRYIAGTLHYFQIPRELWRDRMLRVRALGCNALQTYVLWSVHQPAENRYEFTRDANFTDYLALAKELGFVVVLRIGPYIDAEVDMGGFPYWLLKKKGIVLRSSKDERYLKAVETWLTFLLVTIVKPNLYKNGGPIITVQIENEYGSYPECDKKYMTWMRDLTWKLLGNDTILFTTDGHSQKMLQCGTVDGVLPTIDFGASKKSEVDASFALLRQFLPKGPLINSEFYPGWLDLWGNTKHARTPIVDVLNTMKYIWAWNVTSFTIYPAHGGTNWGYQAGGESEPYRGITTGYDFDAPISEGADTTPKFVAMRTVIEQLRETQVQDPIPESPQKYSYGPVRLEWMGSILDVVHSLTPIERVVNATYPLTMEDLDQAYGFVLYETTIPKRSGRLEVKGVRDRAYVIVDGQLTSVIQRGGNGTKIIRLSNFKSAAPTNGTKIHILVENQGRVCYGPGIYDPKGLVENITLNDEVLTNWTMYPIDLANIYKLGLTNLMRMRNSRGPIDRASKYLPSVYYGYFFADPKAGDTYFDPSGWGKGQLYINGRNIGRYWPQAGPQITLYVPGVYLMQSGNFNQIYVFELDQPGGCEMNENSGCWAEFTNQAKYVK